MSVTIPIEQLRAAYAEWHTSKADSVDLWEALMADDIDFRTLAAGRGIMPLNIQNKAEAVAYLNALRANMNLNRFEFDQFVVDGDTVVAIGSTSWTIKATQKPVVSPMVAIWRFNGSGKAIAYSEFYDTACFVDAMTPDA